MTESVILLVEDNVANRIVVARDGVEALDFLFCRGAFAARPKSELPKLVLLDLNIPKVNGLQVLEQLRANPATKTLPVVILTSSKEEQDLAQSYNLGASSYIRKPVDFAQFSEAIRTLGVYWLVLNESPPS
jgi:two-component system response regulator